MALELVYGAFFGATGTAGRAPSFQMGFGAKFGRNSAENRPKIKNSELPMNREESPILPLVPAPLVPAPLPLLTRLRAQYPIVTYPRNGTSPVVPDGFWGQV